jgi:alkylation response protein AidB-like acyl-CoA dehydrogenase
MIWLPRETEGLEIVPIETMGGRETNTLYLTDVEAPPTPCSARSTRPGRS